MIGTTSVKEVLAEMSGDEALAILRSLADEDSAIAERIVQTFYESLRNEEEGEVGEITTIVDRHLTVSLGDALSKRVARDVELGKEYAARGQYNLVHDLLKQGSKNPAAKTGSYPTRAS